jgi:hypothetical protein
MIRIYSSYDLLDIRKNDIIPSALSETNYLSNLFRMQMFGHRIKYIYSNHFCSIVCCSP